jgi:hypothetical protein
MTSPLIGFTMWWLQTIACCEWVPEVCYQYLDKDRKMVKVCAKAHFDCTSKALMPCESKVDTCRSRHR